MNAALRRLDAAVLSGAALYLYANLFARPGTAFLLGGDQALFWTNALRMMQGDLIYRDFLEFTPPGTDLIYRCAFALFGAQAWSANLVVLLLGMILCFIGFRLAASIMKPEQAALAAALFLVLIYGRMLNGTHHWFSVLAVVGAVALLIRTTTPTRVLLAGTLLGVATFFTQTRGPIAALGVAAVLIWDRRVSRPPAPMAVWKIILGLLVPCVIAWSALSAYFIVAAGLPRLWYFQVTYVLHYVTGASDLSVSSPEIRQWLATPDGIVFLSLYVALPVIYAIAWRRRRRMSAAPRENRRAIALLAAVGGALFLEVASSPNWIRVFCVSLPGIILAVWLLGTASSRVFQRWAAVLLWIAVLGVAVRQIEARHQGQSSYLDLPAGRIATTAPIGEKLTWLAQHTRPGEPFFEARWVDVYLPLALKNPSFTDMLEGGHRSRPEFIDESIQQLKAANVRYILWSPRLASPAYPYANFQAFLAARYRRVRSFSDRDEVWERLSP